MKKANDYKEMGNDAFRQVGIHKLCNYQFHTRAWGVDGRDHPPFRRPYPPFRKSTPRMTLPPSEFGTPNFRHLTHPL